MFSKLFNKKKKLETYLCSCCGKHHAGLPMNFSFNAPFYWNEDAAKTDPDNNVLTSDWCVIDGKDFFIRGILEILVTDEKTFTWGVWVSLSKENFQRYMDVYGTKKKLKEKPYFGWFASQLPIYPNTLSIKTNVYVQGNKLRPQISLDHSNPHPLCQEQHNGITMARVHEIIEVIEKENKNSKNI